MENILTLAEVARIEEVGGGHFRVALAPHFKVAPRPGQFAMLRVRDSATPLLRRPLSIHRWNGKEVEFLFRVKGEGTKILSELKSGAMVDVLMPLGRGFEAKRPRPLLVGGGIGVAPLLYLAEDCKKRGLSPKLLLGGRSDGDLLCRSDFCALEMETAFATEDGSFGETGLITALLKKELESGSREELSVHACGPMPMMAAVARLCGEYGVDCEVSLEAHMACGVGACLGCVVKGADGANKRVCKEGPV
ncbi:dihydroorotate dehydrogenase electron transfer subunit, partial [bacterium]